MTGEISYDNENNFLKNKYSAQKSSSGLITFLIKSGIARDTKHAVNILLGVVIVSGILAIIFFFTLIPHTPPAQTPQSPGWPKTITQ